MNFSFSPGTLVLLLVMNVYSGIKECYGQKPLNRLVSVHAKKEPLSSVLRSVSESGKFYFSYNSDILPGDSLVSLTVRDKQAASVLELLLGERYQYRESGNHIIILRQNKERNLTVTGLVTDSDTQAPADYVSIYSRKLLISALTDDRGVFRLRVKDASFPLELTVSKIGYGDTTVVVGLAENENLKISIYPRAVLLDPVIVRNAEGAGTWLGRLFLSTRLRAQSRNISEFFVSLPYQASLTPGLGTHGKMSGQVVNKFSLNLLGGYTAGVKGMELAGGFNISKNDVKYLQMAGIFNVVSGKVEGVQLAGLHNHVMDSLSGVQVSGFSSVVMKESRGLQVSGFLSRTKGMAKGIQMSGVASLTGNESVGVQISGAVSSVRGSFRGVQVAGVINRTSRSFKGFQLAGLANLGAGKVSGMQLAPVNLAKTLRGVQFGVVNVADSASGYSIGLINIIKKGNSNISFYANDIAPFNLAWRMGTKKFYSMLLAGGNTGGVTRVFTFGAGFGHEFDLGKKLSLSTELISQNAFMGSWENLPSIYRFQSALNYKINDRFALLAGPAYSIFHSDGKNEKQGYKSFPPKNYPFSFSRGNHSGWLGWQVDISWRYGR